MSKYNSGNPKPLPIDDILYDFNVQVNFWSFVDRKDKSDDECWLWDGYTRDSGKLKYPAITIKYKLYIATRVAFVLQTKIDPGKLLVLHNCHPNEDNPLCVNIKHLWLGTHSENQIDSINKGTHYLSQLEETNIVNIRNLFKEGMKIHKIALMYGMSDAHIYMIINGQRWGHVK